MTHILIRHISPITIESDDPPGLRFVKFFLRLVLWQRELIAEGLSPARLQSSVTPVELIKGRSEGDLALEDKKAGARIHRDDCDVQPP